MKKFSLVSMVVLSSVFLASCGGGDVAVDEAPETIKIGVATPVSGGMATYGTDMVNMFSVAVDEVNATGGINGQMVELVVEDSKCDAKEGANAMNKLVNVDNVQVIMGGCSGGTIAGGKIARARGVPVVSPWASSPLVADVPTIFRFWNDADVTKVIAGELMERGFENVAILVENTDYGVGYGDGVAQHFDGEVVMYEKIDPAEKDLRIVAKKVANNMEDIDAVVFAPNTETIGMAVLNAFEEEGIGETLRSEGRLFVGEIASSQKVIRELGNEKMEGIYSVLLSNVEQLGPKAADVIAKFEAEHEVLAGELFIPLVYEGAQLIFAAIEANGNEKAGIIEYLSGVDENNVRDGVFGEYYFKADGDAVGIDFYVNEIQNGELVVIQ